MFLPIRAKSFIFLTILLRILWAIGITVEGVIGALAAGRVRMDLLGVSTIMCMTAINGGTLRDVILGHYPLVWVASPQYLLVVVGAALTTVLLADFLVKHFQVVLLVAGVIGLSAFSIVGARVTMEMGHGVVIAIVDAILTGAFGGVLRDLMCDRVPLAFQKELYASIVVVAATLYYVLNMVGLDENINIICAVLSTLFIRLAALWRGWSLPVFDYQGRD